MLLPATSTPNEVPSFVVHPSVATDNIVEATFGGPSLAGLRERS